MALTDPLDYSDHQIEERTLVAKKRGWRVPVALTGNVTLDNTYPSKIGLDPGGSGRDVILDGSSVAVGDSNIHGLERRIVNLADGAEDLTMKDALGNTIGTVSQNEFGDFYHDEDTGWTLQYLVSIALS